jgi:hypothetical protein
VRIAKAHLQEHSLQCCNRLMKLANWKGKVDWTRFEGQWDPPNIWCLTLSSWNLEDFSSWLKGHDDCMEFSIYCLWLPSLFSLQIGSFELHYWVHFWTWILEMMNLSDPWVSILFPLAQVFGHCFSSKVNICLAMLLKLFL